MADGIRARKRTELQSKAAALEREFEHWRAASAPGKDFEKHHSQIRRITSRIDGLIAARTRELAALADADVLVRGQSIAEKVLAAHLIWEFFRSRVALRADAYLKPFLQACDEFAWSCYEGPRARFLASPRRAAGAASPPAKEPPLVYLNGGWSPFAVSRDRAFELDRPTFDSDRGGTPWLQAFEFAEVMRGLPVPLIGLPWYQVSHLPDVLVLGHEMGHVVEWDFGLTATIERAVQRSNVDDERRPAWMAWRREVFADIYGCLAGGPRFGTTLADFLAADEDQVRSEKRSAMNWGDYPTRWMRLSLVAETLVKMGFQARGEKLVADWQAVYGPPQHQKEFESDVNAIVEAILEGPYESLQGKDPAAPSLTAVMSFRKDALGGPMGEGGLDALRAGKPIAQANAREVFAAARALYDRDPGAFATAALSRTICESVVAAAPKGTRGTSPGGDLDALAKQEALAGEEWF